MRKNENHDFGCWVIKYDHSNHNGRYYREGSLKDNDGSIVPLVWNHEHDKPDMVLGHALLNHSKNGIYTYGTLTGPNVEITKELLRDRGSVSLSPYIVKYEIEDNQIVGGIIREVSLVPVRIDQNEIYYPVLKEKNGE